MGNSRHPLGSPLQLGGTNSLESAMAAGCEHLRLQADGKPDATLADAVTSLSKIRNLEIASLLPEDRD